AEALDMTDLNGGAFFDAEFVIGHGAAPYRKGQVLHSVFAAARLFHPLTMGCMDLKRSVNQL
ncbi:hypothetical protein, partial [Pseudomonas gregormendelii]|uniref:hypothetical protein n=1 Tax=Pseudomonas gregormendelii TaxID=1628277 RepID=UPI00197D2C82